MILLVFSNVGNKVDCFRNEIFGLFLNEKTKKRQR